MNSTIIITTLRERFSQPNRWFAAALLFLLPVLTTAAGAGLHRQPYLDVIMIWLVGAGIIGEEIASGTILLVLSRPLTRTAYVLSKWAALSMLTAGLFILQAALGWGLAIWNGGSPESGTMLSATGMAILRGVGAAAVMMPFSVAISGGKEISAIMISWALGTMLELWGRLKQMPWLQMSGTVITKFLLPSIDLAAPGPGLVSVPGQIAVFLITVIGALTAAILLLERRELSYSAG